MLILSAIDSDKIVVIGVFIISSLLNIAYLLPIVARGFFNFGNKNDNFSFKLIREAPILCWMPSIVTALICVLFFFYAGFIKEYLMLIKLY